MRKETAFRGLIIEAGREPENGAPTAQEVQQVWLAGADPAEKTTA